MVMDTQLENGVLYVYVDGDIDVNSVHDLRNGIDQYLDKQPNIVIDCEKLNYIDSTGLGVLVSTLKKVQKYGGSIKITYLKPYLYRIFEVTALSNLFNIEVQQ